MLVSTFLCQLLQLSNLCSLPLHRWQDHVAMQGSTTVTAYVPYHTAELWTMEISWAGWF